MLWRETQEQEPELVEFDLNWRSRLYEGQPAIPLWLDVIHQRLVRRLKGI